MDLDCDVAREALSARIDGEREPVPALRVDEHLGACAGCRQWYSRVVEQRQQLRRLAGRSQVSSVPAPSDRSPATTRRRHWTPATWQRLALAFVGVVQITLAAAQGLGADVGMPAGHDAMMGGHLLNESTAWSAALGVVMVIAALRPAVAVGLAAVLAVFTVILAGYVISDATAGGVTLLRVLSHLPVLVGTALAFVVWWGARPSEPEPRSDAASATDDIVLPDSATRGRRRGHLYPTDGSAA